MDHCGTQTDSSPVLLLSSAFHLNPDVDKQATASPVDWILENSVVRYPTSFSMHRNQEESFRQGASLATVHRNNVHCVKQILLLPIRQSGPT